MATLPPASPRASFKAEDEYDMVDRNAMAHVQSFFEGLTDAECLEFCLGLEDITDPRFRNVHPMAYIATVICFDTEGWNADSSKLTEVGFNRFYAAATRSVDAGPWGENFLSAASFYHARIAENSHLQNRR